MSQKIEVRTKADDIAFSMRTFKDQTLRMESWHDALAAHALLRAIAESRQFASGSTYGPDALNWIEQRAATLLRDWLSGEAG